MGSDQPRSPSPLEGRPASSPRSGDAPAEELNGPPSEGYSASFGQVEDHEAEGAELDGILGQFSKRAEGTCQGRSVHSPSSPKEDQTLGGTDARAVPVGHPLTI